MLSKTSVALLKDAHPLLAQVALAVAAKGVAFRVICSHRGKAAQELAFKTGKSKARFGDSAHNYMPSVAIDVAPGWDGALNWNDSKAFAALAKEFRATAKALKIPLRWGGDWDMDGQTSDEKFVDSPHFELHPWRTYAKQGVLK
jgi:peptidoglycan L-alanyl-D-glutamate endopeptidase CwlK